MYIIICGHARHGKDTAAEVLSEELDAPMVSSSMLAAEFIVMPHLEKLGITYDSVQECFQDRFNHREAWYDAILDFNQDDPGRLFEEGVDQGSQIYCGMRDRSTLATVLSRYPSTIAIWIDASKRIKEKDLTCKIRAKDCSFEVTNNGTVYEFEEKLRRLARWVQGRSDWQTWIRKEE